MGREGIYGDSSRWMGASTVLQESVPSLSIPFRNHSGSPWMIILAMDDHARRVIIHGAG